VLTGSLSSVKEQVAGTYAERFARSGLAALAFDRLTAAMPGSRDTLSTVIGRVAMYRGCATSPVTSNRT
jgi:hypothetical protein